MLSLLVEMGKGMGTDAGMWDFGRHQKKRGDWKDKGPRSGMGSNLGIKGEHQEAWKEAN